MMKVGVIVLNYINYHETIECVDSILTQNEIEIDVVIVDNGSPNNSFKILSSQYEEKNNVILIQSKKNLGYARGNNLGICYLRKLNIDFIFIINSDTYFTSCKIIKQLIDSYSDDVGILIPIIHNSEGVVDQRVVFYKKFIALRIIKSIIKVKIRALLVNMPLHSWHHQGHSNLEINQRISGLQKYLYVVSGSAFVLTPSFFRNYNQIFPKTFLYFEEWGIIIYLWKAHLLSKIVETDPILHKGAASTPENMKFGSIIKKRLASESASEVLKLLFLSKKTIHDRYS